MAKKNLKKIQSAFCLPLLRSIMILNLVCYTLNWLWSSPEVDCYTYLNFLYNTANIIVN